MADVVETPAEDQVYYYTEIASRGVYEVKFFDKFVLVRQPLDFRNIRKIDIKTFGREFDLYAGDMSMVEPMIEQACDMLQIN